MFNNASLIIFFSIVLYACICNVLEFLQHCRSSRGKIDWLDRPVFVDFVNIHVEVTIQHMLKPYNTVLHL